MPILEGPCLLGVTEQAMHENDPAQLTDKYSIGDIPGIFRYLLCTRNLLVLGLVKFGETNAAYHGQFISRNEEKRRD